MPHNGLTGLTTSKVNTHACVSNEHRPVRPVRKAVPDGSDGPNLLIPQARVRAHPRVERQAAKPSDPSGRGTAATVVREAGAEIFHLAASQSIRIGYIICGPGVPLCGFPGALQPGLDTLFAPEVTCWLCAALAERDGITAGGNDAA